MDDRKDMSGRSSEEIRAEIDRTRAEMHNTVDQLEARLSPGQILDELWGRMRSGGASGMGGAGELVREHPVPLALMGLGIAMLAVEHSKHRGGHSSDGRGYIGDQGRAEGRVGPYRGDEVDHIKFSDDGASSSGSGSSHGGGLKDKASGIIHGAKDAVSGVGEKLSGVGDRIGDATDGLKERASHLADSAGERLGGMREHAGELRGQAGDTARRAVGGIDRVIHDQPLIAGAITFGLGLAAGLAVPTTRFENERLGETSDHLKDSAKQVASQVGEKALEVASQTVDAVKDAASEIKDEINDPELKDALVTKAKAVADVAKSTVGDAMENVSGAIGGAANEAADKMGAAGSSSNGSSSTGMSGSSSSSTGSSSSGSTGDAGRTGGAGGTGSSMS